MPRPFATSKWARLPKRLLASRAASRPENSARAEAGEAVTEERIEQLVRDGDLDELQRLANDGNTAARDRLIDLAGP